MENFILVLDLQRLVAHELLLLVGKTSNRYLQNLLVSLNPSCLHATRASGAPNWSSHTVPQRLLKQTSRRPVLLVAPPTSLTANRTQAKKGMHISYSYPWAQTKHPDCMVSGQNTGGHILSRVQKHVEKDLTTIRTSPLFGAQKSTFPTFGWTGPTF